MSKMTVGQAIVRFLDSQYVELDGQVTKFVDGVFTIFGHGIVVTTHSIIIPFFQMRPV